MRVLKTIDHALALFLKWLLIILSIGIAVILFLRVIVRFTPVTLSMSWTDEVVAWLMSWMIFTGATLIMRKSDHFRVDLIQERFAGKKWVELLNIVIALLGLAFFAAFLYYSIDLVKKTNSISPMLLVPVRYAYLSMPVNCALILIYQMRDLIQAIILLFKPKSSAESGDLLSSEPSAEAMESLQDASAG